MHKPGGSDPQKPTFKHLPGHRKILLSHRDLWKWGQLQVLTHIGQVLGQRGWVGNSPQLYVLPCVRLIWLFHVGELKVEGLGLSDLSGPSQVLHQGHKLMVIPAVIIEFWKETTPLPSDPRYPRPEAYSLGRASQIALLHICF